MIFFNYLLSIFARQFWLKNFFTRVELDQIAVCRLEMQSKRPRGRPKSQFAESTAGTLQSLDRALQVLTALARAGRASLSDLSLSLGVPPATTHRILTTLQKHAFAAFDEERQHWMIGIEAYRTGAAYLSRTSLTEIGRPILRQLTETTGETANLSVADGAEVVFVEQVETRNPVRACFASGARTPMHASGSGKAILACLPRPQAEKLLQKAGLRQFTDHTLVTPAALFDDLEQTRTRRWSLDREERYLGMSCVGAAIFDDKGEPVAGVSISGPASRFTEGRIAELGKAVSDAAEEITRRSGGIRAG